MDMARLELLKDPQAELVRDVVRTLSKSTTQATLAKTLGVSQQTISKVRDSKHPVGITIAVRLADAGYVDLAAVLSNPPARWNGQVGTLDRAFVQLAYERPYTAGAYAAAALELKHNPAAFSGRDPSSLTVGEVASLIRSMVGEFSVPTLPEPEPKALPPKAGS